VRLRARVISGFGVGAKFVKIPVYYDIFLFYLGKEPYPGTLNVEVVEGPKSYVELAELCRPIEVPEQRWGDRVLGALYMWFAMVEHPFKCKAVIIRPMRSRHPPNVLEIVAPRYIRGEFGVRDGDEVVIRLFCGK